MEKCICFHCIEEPFLKTEVRKQGKRRKCSYCHRTAKSYELEEMAGRVETALNQFYERTSTEPDDWAYYRLKELDEPWVRDGEPIVDVIEVAAEMPREAAQDLQEMLEAKYEDFDDAVMGIETEYAADSHYTLKDHSDNYWQEQWDRFEQSVKHQGRLFNATAKAILESIFEDLQDLQTYKGKPIIIKAGPDTDLSEVYRARAFTSDAALRKALEDPALQLGPPPAKLAVAGRMNSHGIAFFYGATSPKVAISEVRPPVGSKVAVACFHILRSLQLLDLEALMSIRATGSIFDPAELARREKQTFLRKLTRLLTTSVMPGEEELEYIPTQAIADFLAERMDPPLDGIQFSSVQSGGVGLNIVLFHKSSSVEALQRPHGTEITVQLGYESEEIYENYAVFEKQPMPTLGAPPEPTSAPALSSVLEIDLEAIEIHTIQAVTFTTEQDPVSWIKTTGKKNDLDEADVFGTLE